MNTYAVQVVNSPFNDFGCVRDVIEYHSNDDLSPDLIGFELIFAPDMATARSICRKAWRLFIVENGRNNFYRKYKL